MPFATASACSCELTGWSAMTSVPPPRAPAASPRAIPIDVPPVLGSAVATISCLRVGSQQRTVTDSTWRMPVTRGRKSSRASPQTSRTGVPSATEPAAGRKCKSCPVTRTSNPISSARRQSSSQSVSLLCWTNGTVPAPDSMVPVDSPLRPATALAMSP